MGSGDRVAFGDVDGAHLVKQCHPVGFRVGAVEGCACGDPAFDGLDGFGRQGVELVGHAGVGILVEQFDEVAFVGVFRDDGEAFADLAALGEAGEGGHVVLALGFLGVVAAHAVFDEEGRDILHEAGGAGLGWRRCAASGSGVCRRGQGRQPVTGRTPAGGTEKEGRRKPLPHEKCLHLGRTRKAAQGLGEE